MHELTKQDLYWIRTRLPSLVLTLIGEHRTPVPIMLSGGFIRAAIAGEPIQDIDLFCNDKERARTLALGLANRANAKMVETDNAFTVLGLPYPVQFIHRWLFEKPEDVINSFDFTIARAAMWAEWNEDERRILWRSACDDRFYADLAAKRLTYCSPVRVEEAGGSMLRVLKFYQRGYRIPLDSLGAVVARLVSAVNADEIHGAIANAKERGVTLTTEQQMAFVLTGLLRDVDPAIDPDHRAHLPNADAGEPTGYHG